MAMREIKVDGRDDKRGNERLWMKKRIRWQMRKSSAWCSIAIRVNATPSRISGAKDLCRGNRSSNQRSVRFNRRWEAPGVCLFSRMLALYHSSRLTCFICLLVYPCPFFAASNTTCPREFANKTAGDGNQNERILRKRLFRGTVV